MDLFFLVYLFSVCTCRTLLVLYCQMIGKLLILKTTHVLFFIFEVYLSDINALKMFVTSSGSKTFQVFKNLCIILH